MDSRANKPRNNKVPHSRRHSLQYNQKRKHKCNTDEDFRKRECLRIRKSKQKKKDAISLRVAELGKRPTGEKECVVEQLVRTGDKKKGKQGVAKRKTQRNRKEYTKNHYSIHGPAIRRQRMIGYHRNLLQIHTLKMKKHLKKLAELGDYTADELPGTQTQLSKNL